LKDLSITLSIISGSWEKQVADNLAVVKKVGGLAMTKAVDRAKAEGRSSIASAGFSRKWQNALRGTVYPNEGYDAAGTIHHQIPYAGVFEDGASIKGNPMLWLRLRSTPKLINRRTLTPSAFSEQVGRLTSFKGRSGTPLLGVRIRLPGGRNYMPSKITLAMIRKGLARPTGRFVTIPLFHGVRQATIPRKFSVRDVCAAARDSLPQYYAEAFVEVAPNG
jgi:hypothetical protein